MSHFVRIQTKIREREHLVQALKDLHCQFREGERLVVGGFGTNTETAQVVVNTGSKYDIGFRRTAQEFEVVADWWGVELYSQLRKDSFVQRVSQRYSYNVVKAQAVEDHLLLLEETELANGDIVILLSERG